MKTYTMEDWRNDRTFKAIIGQQVAEEVYQQFLNCVPPEYYRNGILQVGEPYGLIVIDGKYYDTFTTFTGSEGHRTFSGHMPSLVRTPMSIALRHRN